jgi:zinc/manganese transport system substrate-binding protein
MRTKHFAVASISTSLTTALLMTALLAISFFTSQAYSSSHVAGHVSVHLSAAPQSGKSGDRIRAVATLPEVAEVLRAVGGEEVEVTSFLTGSEDPHFVDANPGFMTKAARADVVCAMGLELESGWLPKVLSKAANASVQPGGKGFCELGKTVQVLDRATSQVDRSMGDVHASGNPHFNLSPKAMAEGSDAVVVVLSAIRPEKRELFLENQKLFKKQMHELEQEVRSLLTTSFSTFESPPLFIEYHKEFAYFFNLYGLRSFGAIEAKPGVPPSASRLAEISLAAKSAGVKLALASRTSPRRHVQRFSELSGVPAVTVSTVTTSSASIAETQREIAHAIAKSLKK